MESKDLQDGVRRFTVSPGTYKVEVFYTETAEENTPSFNDPRQVTEALRIDDDREVTREFYFGKGTVRIVASDHDGSARVFVSVRRQWSKTAKGRTKSGFSWVSRDSSDDGVFIADVAPGVYMISVAYDETVSPVSRDNFVIPRPHRTFGPFALGDGETVTREVRFERGFINLVATDVQGWANGSVALYQEVTWTEGSISKTEFRYLRDDRLRDGTLTFPVEPGHYLVKVRQEKSLLELALSVSDQQVHTVTADLGSATISSALRRSPLKTARVPSGTASFSDSQAVVDFAADVGERLDQQILKLESVVVPSHLAGLTELRDLLGQVGEDGLPESNPKVEASAFLASLLNVCSSRPAVASGAPSGSVSSSPPPLCAVVPADDQAPSAVDPRGLVKAISFALGATGFSEVGVVIDTASDVLTLSVAPDGADPADVGARIVEAMLGTGLSGLSGLSGAGGVAGMFSTPAIKDGQLVMEIRLPFNWLIEGEFEAV